MTSPHPAEPRGWWSRALFTLMGPAQMGPYGPPVPPPPPRPRDAKGRLLKQPKAAAAPDRRAAGRRSR